MRTGVDLLKQVVSVRALVGAALLGGAVGVALFLPLHQPGIVAALLLIVPLYLTYHTYKVYIGRIEDEEQEVKQTAELHLATIEALARAIDAKDQRSHNHVWRVQLYAARLAQALGLTDEETEGIKTAALLHDIGKLAVPEHILSKTEKLTNEELEKVHNHSQIGAEIISGVPFPYPVAAAILSHHERWDGSGYPHHLQGEAIPLGARILAVVDCFDSATSARAYHDAMDHRKGAELITRESGASLDPRLVTTFIALLPSLLAESATQEQKTFQSTGLGVGVLGTSSGGPAADRPESVFENIAMAHREVYALYEIAQSMSTSLGVADTMTLISSKLTKIVPWSGCSLFVYDRALESLTCAFGAGLDAPQLVNRTISNDERLADWVGGHKRTLVNADPRPTFEAAGPDGHTDLKSAMVCPLYFANTFVGVFSVYHVDPERYTEDHRRLFERVAEQTATALHNSLLFEQTREDAMTDQLTGLPNRRWLGRYLPQELSRADRPSAEVALIAIDIDDFKTINDTHGHDVGDQALRAVATALQAVCRSYDVCARHGGDEFVVVLPDCSRDAAEVRRQELQQRLGDIEIDVAPDVRLRLGASAGVAVFPHDGHSCEALLEVADRRMYRDKAARAVRARRPTRRGAAQPIEAGAAALSGYGAASA
jgi:diguanylate cyclase (GGDEF)-like protein/putative nucleotidyltransferase with HDIG domain